MLIFVVNTNTKTIGSSSVYAETILVKEDYELKLGLTIQIHGLCENSH